jgi:hypothetical protein
MRRAEKMATDFTKTEREVVVLKAIWEMIDEMVNYEMFAKLEHTREVTLLNFTNGFTNMY